MTRYPETAVWDEITYLAYHLHWSLGDLLDLEHRERLQLVERVTSLDRWHRTGTPSPPQPHTPHPPLRHTSGRT